MKLSLTLLASVLAVTGCGAVQVQTPLGSSQSAKANEPAAQPKAAPADVRSETAVTSAPATAPASSTTSPAHAGPTASEREAENQLRQLSERADEIAKSGKVSVSAAVDGFSPDERRAFVVSLFKAPEKPSDALLSRVNEALAKQRAAAESAAKKENLSKPGAPDPGAERAIRQDFERRLPGVQIKSVKMLDSNWKVNHTDFGVVRNRYKNAEVVIVIKGTKTCVAVPANAAQKSVGGGKFATDYEFDQFLGGSAVPCP